MLHVVQLHIADHPNWGVTHYCDVVLPNKINHIRSVFASAQLGLQTFVIPTLFPNINGGSFQTSPFDMPSYDPFIGNLSVSINNNDIIVPDIPIYAQAKMQTSMQRGRFDLEKPCVVRNGSTLRIVMEERLVCPFYNRNLAMYSDQNRKAFMAYQGLNTDLELTNDYTIKLYIEYD